MTYVLVLMSYDLCFMNYIFLYNNYVSPIKWGDILFLALLSVRPSVCLLVRPLYIFEPMVGFTNNYAPMSSLM